MVLLALAAILGGAATWILLGVTGHAWAWLGFPLGGSATALLAGVLLYVLRQQRRHTGLPRGAARNPFSRVGEG